MHTPTRTHTHITEDAAVRTETKTEKVDKIKADDRGDNKHRGKGAVSFDRPPLQHLHIFKSRGECHAWGLTKTSQWEGCVPAAGSEAASSLPAAPWEKPREVVWEPRGPRSWTEGGEPLVARDGFAFYLCPFCSVTSAPALQPQMADMIEGLAFVSKMIMMEVVFF